MSPTVSIDRLLLATEAPTSSKVDETTEGVSEGNDMSDGNYLTSLFKSREHEDASNNAEPEPERRILEVTDSWQEESQNELPVDLVIKFVTFFQNKYPAYGLKHLVDLQRKLVTLRTSQEAEEIASQIISMVDQIKAEDTSPPALLQTEAIAYNSLGHIAFKDGTKEGMKMAVSYFEKCRHLSNSIDDAESAVIAEANLSNAKASYEKMAR